MTDEEKPKCRWCRQDLDGHEYYTGKPAYHPVTGKKAKACHYGGWVCSEGCDYRATLELEQSMPGHHMQKELGYDMRHKIARKWSEE